MSNVKLPFPTEAPDWSSDMAAALRQFLNTPSGQQMLRTLAWYRPTITPLPASPDADINLDRRRVESDIFAGYEQCLQSIIQLTQSEKPNG